MTYYLIYKITNKVNGKIYIGQHQTEDLNDGYMGSGTAIRRAIKKHGVENFTKEILYFCTDFDTMNMMEEMLVNEVFVARKDTYNMALGGMGGKHPQTKETREKISRKHMGKNNPNFGKHPSFETRQKLSCSHKGKQAWNKGKHLSEEQKQKLSIARKGKPKSEEHRRKISEATKGRKSWNKGKHFITDEHRQKLLNGYHRWLQNKTK